MRKKRNLNVRMIAIVLATVMLVMNIPNKLLEDITYVQATESETALQKETAPKESQVKGTEIETSLSEFDNAQNEDEYLLMEEEQEILEAEAVNSSRFLVKYKDADNKNIKKLRKRLSIRQKI